MGAVRASGAVAGGGSLLVSSCADFANHAHPARVAATEAAVIAAFAPGAPRTRLVVVIVVPLVRVPFVLVFVVFTLAPRVPFVLVFVVSTLSMLILFVLIFFFALGGALLSHDIGLSHWGRRWRCNSWRVRARPHIGWKWCSGGTGPQEHTSSDPPRDH